MAMEGNVPAKDAHGAGIQRRGGGSSIVAGPRRSWSMSAQWLESLSTRSPQEGFELALRLSRASIKAIQPSETIRKELRSSYDSDAEQLIAASHVVAVNFATIAAANAYWREK
jgi:hypothetical protein